MPIRVKRVYEAPAPDDGFRVLVDRLWPRGLSKEAVRVDLWLREAAPSNELRRWYQHDPAKWAEFRKRYAAELKGREELLRPIAERARKRTVTLLFSCKEERLNNAVALQEMIERLMRPKRAATTAKTRPARERARVRTAIRR